MWTFCNVRLKKFENFPTEWVLKITSIEELIAYHTITAPPRVEAAFEDAIAYSKILDKKDHSRNTYCWVSDIMSKCTGDSWVGSLIKLTSAMEANQKSVLLKGDILYIKFNGSYSHNTQDESHYKVLETKTSDVLEFPNLTPRFIQWPNGKHWYLKMGEKDVVVHGKQKWDTRQEAEKALKEFVADGYSMRRW